jgi:hypothetical protein
MSSFGGRDAALLAAQGMAREPGPKGETPDTVGPAAPIHFVHTGQMGQ